jgi:hypothetical protein
MIGKLLLDFCGEIHAIEPDKVFSFGRSADLVVDVNKYLHRVMGTCFVRDGWWWLHNAGSHLPLRLEGQLGGASMTLSPGGTLPLVLGPMTVRFAAGGTSYELTLEAEEVNTDLPMTSINLSGETTIDAADMPLTPEQLLLLVALAEPRLTKGPTAELPSNQDIIDRFEWTTTKFNRKLDNLCSKFARRGVDGLVGGVGKIAGNRRQVLVDHVVSSGMVTVDQLPLLPRKGRSPHRT